MKINEMFPYLRVRNAAAAIAFYEQAFGVKEKFRLTEPSGRIGHAELDFGCGTLMLSEEFPEHGILGPASRCRSAGGGRQAGSDTTFRSGGPGR